MSDDETLDETPEEAVVVEPVVEDPADEVVDTRPPAQAALDAAKLKCLDGETDAEHAEHAAELEAAYAAHDAWATGGAVSPFASIFTEPGIVQLSGEMNVDTGAGS